jgi:hypothetical protein
VRRIIASEDLFDELADSGLIADAAMTSRVVIDLRRGHVPVVHVEQHGDAQLLEVARTLGGIEVSGGRGGRPAGLETKEGPPGDGNGAPGAPSAA